MDFSPQNVTGPYQESWYLKLIDPIRQRALHLNFVLMVSNNDFRRVAEAWAIYFQRVPGREMMKMILRQTFDLRSFSPHSSGGFELGPIRFMDSRTYGSIQSKGRTIEWDLNLAPRQEASFDHVPPFLKKSRIFPNTIETKQADLAVTGSCTINGEKLEWSNAPGMSGRQSGPKSPHAMIWGHCNTFVNEHGVPVPFVFEGITFRTQVLGGIPTPKLTSLNFVHQDKIHRFDSIRDSVRLKSKYSLNEWRFQAERGDLLFRGHSRVEHRDFAGISYEDTSGSLLYCASSKLSDLEVHVYNRGKLETALRGEQTASIDIISRKKNPYVPILV